MEYLLVRAPVSRRVRRVDRLGHAPSASERSQKRATETRTSIAIEKARAASRLPTLTGKERNSAKSHCARDVHRFESGKHDDRPELAKAIAACKKHRARLIIAKLDRLSRDVAFIATLMKGMDFLAADNPHASKLTIHIMAAMAEFERDAISKRTKEALATGVVTGERGAAQPASTTPSVAKLALRRTRPRTMAVSSFFLSGAAVIATSLRPLAGRADVAS